MTRTAKHCLLPALVFHLLAGPAMADEAVVSHPPDVSLADVAGRIDRASHEHPRLFATADDFAALRASREAKGAKAALAKVIVHQADLMRDAKPIERKLQGKRLLTQSRICVKRVLTLSMAYHLTGEARYARRAEKEMLAAARFSDWNPSHFLDVGEMTLALGIGYDWLYHTLNATSRATIREAIRQKGLVLPFETRHRGWIRARNNWGQVCHGGLTVGALAVMEDEPELAAKTVHNAVSNVTRSMAAYAPNGSYPEGPGYWAYGTSYNVLLIDALESVLGTDFGLSEAPGFDKTGAYMSLMRGPSGLMFNYCDGGAGRSLQPALHWFAARYDRPDWLLDERKLLADRLPEMLARRSPSHGDRLLPMALVWMGPEQPAVENRMPLSWSAESRTAVTVHRSSWTDPNATFIGLKGGAPNDSHGQMDIGSFVLDADGVRWAMDLGAEGYYGIESRGMNLWDRSQDSDRWTIFRQMNHGHNTLVIDDQLQRAAGRGTIESFSPAGANAPAHTLLDMSDVYKGQAESVKRLVTLTPDRAVRIQDTLTGLKPGSCVRWAMITPARPAAPGRKTIELRQGDARLTMTIDSAPAEAVWQVLDSATPRSPWDSANRGTAMIAFEAIAPESGALTLVVVATPGSCVDSPTALQQ